MNTQCKFDFLEAKDVEVRFDGGTISTDAGLSVLVEWMNKESFIKPYASVLEESDERDPSRTDHSMEQLVRQRVLQLIGGYEDANDSDQLRTDPIFQAANDRVKKDESNASQPTISRLENTVDARDVVKLNHQLIEDYIDGYQQKPERIGLEIDSSGASAHGTQQRALFQAYRGQTQYHPLMIADTRTGELLSVRLRGGSVSDKHRAYPELKRVLGRLTEAFPQAQLRLRADSGFTDARLFRLLDEYEVDWMINYAPNEVLKRRTADLMETLNERFEASSQPVTGYRVLDGYQAQTWNRPRSVVAKVECGPQGTNRRFVVCSHSPSDAQTAYERYAGRGVCEQYIKELKDGYRGEKFSCHRFVANAFRLIVYALAYTAVARFRFHHLRGTDLEGAWIETIRRTLFKLGARIKITARRMWIHASEDWPYQDLFLRVARSVAQKPG